MVCGWNAGQQVVKPEMWEKDQPKKKTKFLKKKWNFYVFFYFTLRIYRMTVEFRFRWNVFIHPDLDDNAFSRFACQRRSELSQAATLNSPAEHEHASWTWISPFSFRKCQKPPKQIKSTSSNSLFTSLTSLQSGRIRRNKLHVDPFSTGISSHMRIIQSSNIFITPRVMIMQQQTRVICTVLLALPADLLKIKRFTKRNVM